MTRTPCSMYAPASNQLPYMLTRMVQKPMSRRTAHTKARTAVPLAKAERAGGAGAGDVRVSGTFGVAIVVVVMLFAVGREIMVGQNRAEQHQAVLLDPLIS